MPEIIGKSRIDGYPMIKILKEETDFLFFLKDNPEPQYEYIKTLENTFFHYDIEDDVEPGPDLMIFKIKCSEEELKGIFLRYERLKKLNQINVEKNT